MRLIHLLLLVPLAACSKRSTSNITPDAGAAVVTSVASSVALEPEPAEPKVRRVSFAKMTHDVLDECLDVSYQGEFDAGGIDPDEAWAKRAAPKDKDAVVLRKSCAAQFSDRTPLATCTIATKNGDAGVGSIVVRHYAFEGVGLNDAAMKDCFGLKGDWEAVSRDSAEWHMAKLEYSRRQLHKLTGQALSP